jgi:hypothetical protein
MESLNCISDTSFTGTREPGKHAQSCPGEVTSPGSCSTLLLSEKKFSLAYGTVSNSGVSPPFLQEIYVFSGQLAENKFLVVFHGLLQSLRHMKSNSADTQWVQTRTRFIYMAQLSGMVDTWDQV